MLTQVVKGVLDTRNCTAPAVTKLRPVLFQSPVLFSREIGRRHRIIQASLDRTVAWSETKGN